MPVVSGFENRSVRYAAIASQKINMSAPFALVASNVYSEQTKGFPTSMY
jgi:hypothetical protein